MLLLDNFLLQVPLAKFLDFIRRSSLFFKYTFLSLISPKILYFTCCNWFVLFFRFKILYTKTFSSLFSKKLFTFVSELTNSFPFHVISRRKTSFSSRSWGLVAVEDWKLNTRRDHRFGQVWIFFFAFGSRQGVPISLAKRMDPSQPHSWSKKDSC